MFDDNKGHYSHAVSRFRPEAILRSHLLSLGVALLTVATPLVRQSQAAPRGPTVVPAPVGPVGALPELYAGSYALRVGVSRDDALAPWGPLESIPQELDSLATSLRQMGFQQAEVISKPTGDAAFIGEYNLGGAIARVQSSPAGLQLIQAGNPVHTLVSVGGRRYTSSTMPGVSLEFRLDDANEVDALYLSMPQVVVHGVRIEGSAPDAATLGELAGTYDLSPVVAATISVRDGKLIYRLTNDPKDYVLTPARGLHFAFDGLAVVSIRFHRSANGPTSHFVLYPGDTSIVGMRRK